jgi:hypothetical protein
VSDLADFRTRFPEFVDVPDPQITAALSDAALEIAGNVWGTVSTGGVFTLGDLGQMYLAAHNLACTPFGQNARMVAKTADGQKTTTYEVAYRRLQREVSSGFRVTL